MIVFLLILGGFLIGDLLWWRWADRRLRLRSSRRGRALLALFMVALMAQILWLLVHPVTARRMHQWMPMTAIAALYLWHLLVMPLTWLMLGAMKTMRFDPGRRRFFLAAPPVATGVLAAFSVRRLSDLRLRRLDLALPSLPPALSGLTIAHLSDLHVGKFTRPEALEAMVAMVNGLRADLVLLTGDLIDLALIDLPRAMDTVERLSFGTALQMCCGNHDWIESREGFLEGVRGRGLPLLLDAQETVRVRGHPVQLLGVGWGNAKERMARVRALRDPDAFPILLAHHPHAWDEARDFPLVLSGHTHGGQLMLHEALGAGPILYRYWSGAYQAGASNLVVSNGVGNWFPLRTHAPAEVLLVTLRAVE